MAEPDALTAARAELERVSARVAAAVATDHAELAAARAGGLPPREQAATEARVARRLARHAAALERCHTRIAQLEGQGATEEAL